jgi:hypothetical protein
MTLAEFKAWFEGFTESIEAAPTEKQFKRIKAKVAQIDGSAVTYPIFVDRYWPSPRPLPYWHDQVWTVSGTMAPNSPVAVPFNSITAMHELGKLEAVN